MTSTMGWLAVVSLELEKEGMTSTMGWLAVGFKKRA